MKSWAQQTLERMSLEEKAGQVFILSQFSFDENSVERMLERIHKLKLGGVFQFHVPQRRLSEVIEAYQKFVNIPLLVAADYEVGTGWTIKDGFRMPRQMVRGFAGDEQIEQLIGEIIAKQGRAAGVTVTFSPLLDLNSHPDNPDVNIRAYGEDVDKVAALASAQINGLEQNGMLACVKHFPGNGGTGMDQHIIAPILPFSKEEMENTYLEVYRRVFEQTNVGCVMVAHLEVPAYTTEINPRNGRLVPSSASSEIVTDLLRGKLGYKGLIITDALDMGGITSHYTKEERVVKCLQAGCDCLLVFQESCENEVNAVLEAVRSGSLSLERLDDAVLHVLQAKERLGLHLTKGLPAPDEIRRDLFRNENYADFRDLILQKGVTLYRNRGDVLPIGDIKGKRVLVLNTFNPDSMTWQANKDFALPVDITPRLLKDRGALVEEIEIRDYMPNSDLYEILDKVAKVDYTFYNFFIWPIWGVGTLIPNKCALRLFYYGMLVIDKPIIITSFGSPYVMQYCPNAPVYLCTFEEAEAAQRAAVKAWFGEAKITGRSPVNLKDVFSIGDGIEI